MCVRVCVCVYVYVWFVWSVWWWEIYKNKIEILENASYAG